ncbi:hypothetical protein [Streptomyces akebiae]|uniref:Transposase n=1 Tax=Streptomyces akebiae TaxID=2865673 RepID=A0ABX8XXU9_9ACTN|nr:hypothetical protein [Streptomyces akebiae]QYX80343.1 hypothetical protein K1J60_30870 [Streptomyces akebiae]
MAIKVGQHHHKTDRELGGSTYGIKHILTVRSPHGEPDPTLPALRSS